MSRTLAVVLLGLGLTLAFAAEAHAVKRRAFATSVLGSGDLSTWPDAGGQTGLAAGDTICRARAAAASLPNANTYRAWLSTTATDAYCHVQGLTGQRSPGCTGGPPLPAGPWYLANGISPFAASLDRLTDPFGEIYRPMIHDEFGGLTPIAESRQYWTGTDPSGAVSPGSGCQNWTSDDAGDLGVPGVRNGTSQVWTLSSGFSCSTSLRLLCLEPGASEEPVPGWTGRGSIVFVTSAAGNGLLGDWEAAGDATGLAAGDAICRSLAADANLPSPDSFVAWLSTAAVDARDRLTSPGPFRRVDGYVVAGSVADLTDGTTDNSIHVDERGLYRTGGGGSPVFTGTLDDGTASGADCDGWTVAGDVEQGTTGVAAITHDPDWTDRSDRNCGFSHRLYCFSNAVTIFWDGFDYTEDASRWSSVVP